MGERTTERAGAAERPQESGGAAPRRGRGVSRHPQNPPSRTTSPTKLPLDTLPEPELIQLTHRTDAPRRFLREMLAHVKMLEFRTGDPHCRAYRAVALPRNRGPYPHPPGAQ